MTMKSEDAISGSLGKCYIVLDGNRYDCINLIKIEAKSEKKKVEVPILGKPGKGNKAAGWNGTGSLSFHYNSSMFREQVHEYIKTGKDFYFDIEVLNEDPTSSVGRQYAILKNCNLDNATLALIDSTAEYLEDPYDFTFDDYELPEKFTTLEGML
ncbi:phage tail tube protein [Methanolapillus millepedarum]|uniref:Phage-like element PBSX protein XkdM n=1 Tax=Methanolapillus millepedarum TaxID=3028296 RepID=A0AA96V649_9EURY|nr:Phage-like element PBSX protein XkdM [Methanosarcinaceae archaeon Ac7]